jgi:hypothetical protein
LSVSRIASRIARIVVLIARVVVVSVEDVVRYVKRHVGSVVTVRLLAHTTRTTSVISAVVGITFAAAAAATAIAAAGVAIMRADGACVCACACASVDVGACVGVVGIVVVKHQRREIDRRHCLRSRISRHTHAHRHLQPAQVPQRRAVQRDACARERSTRSTASSPLPLPLSSSS